MFITKGDVGVGTIVGSAVFNILFVIGCCGILAGEVRNDTKFINSKEAKVLFETLISMKIESEYMQCV